MPTKPLESLLNRDLSKVSAKEIIDISSPLLKELVNYSTNVFGRCQASATGNKDEDLSVLILYLHIIEMTDAIDVLVSQSCPVPAQILLRSSFEAYLSINYILEKESKYVNRSLSFLVGYVLNRIKMYQLLKHDLPLSNSEKRIFKEKEIPDQSENIKNLNDFLAKPHIKPIAEEYKKEKKIRYWYQLFGGPPNLRALSKYLKKEEEYLFLYKHWSSITHAGDISRFLTKTQNGAPAFDPLRRPNDIKEVTSLAASFILCAIRKLLGKFRPGEDYASWYKREVQERFLWISGNINFQEGH